MEDFSQKMGAAPPPSPSLHREAATATPTGGVFLGKKPLFGPKRLHHHPLQQDPGASPPAQSPKTPETHPKTCPKPEKKLMPLADGFVNGETPPPAPANATGSPPDPPTPPPRAFATEMGPKRPAPSPPPLPPQFLGGSVPL